MKRSSAFSRVRHRLSTIIIRSALVGLSVLLLTAASEPAAAQKRGRSRHSRAKAVTHAPSAAVQKAPVKAPPRDPSAPPVVKASSAIIVDAVSGQVLYAKNADVPRPPASTTKIMTAILLMENTSPDDLIVASKHASETTGSSLNLKMGEEVTARDMLYALMLRSANDGCVAVAEHIAGSEEKFAELMTQKAQQIGATSTQFRNCNGLNCPDHLTTARDLATMARYASQFPQFNEATRSKTAAIARSTDSKDILLKNHAKFLWKFPGADGIKTGWTVPAGRCFVGGATWNGWRLITVVLNSPDVVTETSQLMKYGFQRFEQVTVAAPGQVYATVPVPNGRIPMVPATAKEPIRYIAEKGRPEPVELRPRYEPANAPIAAGAAVGTLEAWSGEKLLGATPLVASITVERVPALSVAGLGTGPYLFGGLFAMVVIGYGTALTKTARIRRYRLKALLRGADRRG